MALTIPPSAGQQIIYPESDGQPVAENTLQFRWIVTIHGGLTALFRDDERVCIAADLFWYPVEGRPEIRVAPDILVVFGRPKGERSSYLQWQEDAIPPQIVFEILSPGNTVIEMLHKQAFYERYGVEEYYLYDPDANTLFGWQRQGKFLVRIDSMHGWISPRLKVRFELGPETLQLFGPDGQPFATYLEAIEQREAAQRHAEQAEQRAEQAEQRAEQAEQRAEQMAARLRALGMNPDES